MFRYGLHIFKHILELGHHVILSDLCTGNLLLNNEEVSRKMVHMIRQIFGCCPAEWPENTLTYFQSSISTTAHAHTDIELLERADSCENTIWKNRIGNPAKFSLKQREFWTLGEGIARAATQTLSTNSWTIFEHCTTYIMTWRYYFNLFVLYINKVSI